MFECRCRPSFAGGSLDCQDIRVILKYMLHHLSPEDVAKQVTDDVYDRALGLSHALGLRIGKPRAPRIAADVADIVRYAQMGNAKLSNEEIPRRMNYVIDTLTTSCYPPATAVARAIFDRKAGEPQSDIELALLAGRARWDIELGLDVPIRWLAALAGVSVKTARNVASSGQLSTQTKREGQVASAQEAARWLGTRGIRVGAGARRAAHAQPKTPQRHAVTLARS